MEEQLNYKIFIINLKRYIKNPWDTDEVRGIFIKLNAFITKQKRQRISELIFRLRRYNNG